MPKARWHGERQAEGRRLFAKRLGGTGQGKSLVTGEIGGTELQTISDAPVLFSFANRRGGDPPVNAFDNPERAIVKQPSSDNG